jgi:hypothetical protein
MMSLKSVSDASEISIFRSELFLGTEKIDRILVTDMLNDGFDENDIIQLFPSGRVLRLQPISPTVDQLLRSYTLPPNTSIHETSKYYQELDSLAYYRSGGRALGYGILGGISERLMKGYQGRDVEGYFKIGSSGSSIQIWNFDSTRVHFPPPARPAQARVDTVLLVQRDTVFTTRTDTIIVMPHPIVIHDTVAIPAELLAQRGEMYYRSALGTLGGEYDMNHRSSSRGKIALGAGNEWDFGVWDPWVSGRQAVDSRIGLRFLAEMAPWKSDTLSPRFLSTSCEGMYIPAWDRSLFVFMGGRVYYHDNLFWDRIRAAWDDDVYKEPAAQHLNQYELTTKLGLDKLAAFGFGKRIGLWLKLSGWVTGGKKSGYDLHIKKDSEQNWHWEHDGGTDLEAALTVRLAEAAQISFSAGQMTIPNLYYEYDSSHVALKHGLFRMQQIYQTAAIRIVPYNVPNESQLVLEAALRNNTLDTKFKQGQDKALLTGLYFPYFETPEISGTIRFDIEVVRIDVGVKYFVPPSNSGDSQIRPFGGLSFMFR